jgi:diaminopimelate decarboxylase
MDMAKAGRMADWISVLNHATHIFGTPCYVVRWQPITAEVARLEMLTSRVPLRCWLSFKTHPVLPLTQRWLRSGRGVEVVSESEFLTVRKLMGTAEGLLINGVAKHAWLPRCAGEHLQVHFDSVTEVHALLPLAVRDSWRLGVRCHVPDECDARDPKFGGQFGMSAREAVESLIKLRDAGADVRGLHFHVGQRPRRTDAYERAIEHVAQVCARARFTPRYIDMGGGLPGPRDADDSLASLQRAITLAGDLFGPELQEIWLENGRFVTEASTALAVRVLDVKVRPEGRYLICDGGRTNHALAADHGVHPLLILPDRHGPLTLTTVCGPTCMTDDVLARVPLPREIAAGDVIVWLNAGAYHLPWETRFSHGLAAVVWCDDDLGPCTLARSRERPEAWSTAWNCTAA